MYKKLKFGNNKLYKYCQEEIEDNYNLYGIQLL